MENTAAKKRKQVPEGYLIIGVDPHKKRHAAVVITQDFSIRDKFKFDNTREGLETLVRRVLLDEVITQIIAVLLKAKVVQLKHVSHDGIRVRASAGQASFRREKSLKECLKEAQEQVKQIAEEREHPDTETSKREQAARERVRR